MIAVLHESRARRRERALRIVEELHRLFPDATCTLHHRNPLELLVATLLSAQCTDERVNSVTPALFERYPTAEAYAGAVLEELEGLIHPTGFFRNKAKAIVGLGRALVERHAGEVPDRMDDLVELPGVGRKTANVILGTWFGKAAIPVDTHVIRLAGRLALSGSTDPVRIERDLQELLPESRWTFASHALILHGRGLCAARKPQCRACPIRPDCPTGKAGPPRS